MKRNKCKTCLFSLGVVFVFFSYYLGISYITRMIQGTDLVGGEVQKHYAAVITKSGNSDFWKSVYAGARAACTEYNLNLTLNAPENEEDYEVQNEMINEVVEAGAEAIIISAIDYNANRPPIEAAIKKGVKVVVVDSDVNSDGVSCRISTDNYKAGGMAGDAVLASREEKLNVGIVNFDKNTANGQQREQGFRDRVEKDDRVTIIETINVISTAAAAREGTVSLLNRHPDINVIVTFNEWTSLGVGYAVQDMQLAESTMVVAFDSNVISVGMLETGEVDALIVQNPYSMGYLGVECAYKLIYGFPIEETEVDTATSLITKENMFDEKYQRVLFPF